MDVQEVLTLLEQRSKEHRDRAESQVVDTTPEERIAAQIDALIATELDACISSNVDHG